MSISREHLNILWTFADATLNEIAKQSPDVFRELSKELAAKKRTAAFNAFGQASTAAQALIGNIDFASPENYGRTIRAAIADLIDAPGIEPEVQQEIVTHLEQFAILDAQTDLVPPSTPLKDHPVFRDALAQSEVMQLATAARLTAVQIDKVLQQVLSLMALHDGRLKTLTEDAVLTPAEAKRLGFMASVANLADGDIELAGLFRSDMDLTPENLIRLTTQNWETMLQRTGTQAPEGYDIKSYAAELQRRVAELYPTETMYQRIMPRRVEDYTEVLAATQSLFTRNTKVAGTAFDALNMTGVNETEKETQREGHTRLRSLARRHPGLGIAHIIDGEGDLQAKTREIGRRLETLARFEQQNSDVDVLGLDLTVDSSDIKALKFDGIQPDDQKRIVSNFKAYQRTYALTGEISRIETLLDAGYSSSVRVASDHIETFIANTGLDQDSARAMYAKAQETAGATIGQFGSILDVVRGGFDRLAVSNVGAAPLDYLRKLDGFADLFGAQEFCDCEHCRSVLSPAAYFVDLMKFIKDTVTDTVFTGAKATDTLRLKNRRPDLWILPLTCENTNTQIPTLDVINEILENYIAVKNGYTDPLDDRIAVMQKVYRDTLPAALDSFRQPFVLPFARVATYLAHFSKTPYDAASALGAAPATRARTKFGFSAPQQAAIITSNVSLDFLKTIYGVDFALNASGKIDPVETKFLVQKAGISRDELGLLRDSQFVTARGGEKFTIVQSKRSDGSVQNDMETVQDLTPAILDRMHRFMRLARNLPTSLSETDFLLDQLSSTLDAAALEALAGAKDVADGLTLTPEQTVALFKNIPNVELQSGKGNLFDRLFNSKAFSLVDGKLPNTAKKFTHPAFATTPPPAGDATLARLMAGLGLTSEQLAALIRELANALQIDLSETSCEDRRGFFLSTENLTLLYRHALLAQTLKLSIPQLFQFIALCKFGGWVKSLAHVQAVCDMHKFRKGSGFTLDDLVFVTGGTPADQTPYPKGSAVAEAIIVEVKTDKLMQFADTVFAFQPGVTEDQSRAIIAANPTVFIAVPDSTYFRLADTFDPFETNSVLIIPAQIHLTPEDAKKALEPFHASSILRVKLAARLSLQVQQLPKLLTMIGANLSAPDVVQSINGGSVDPLAKIVSGLVPLAVMFKHAAFDTESLGFIYEHSPIFSIPDFKALKIGAVQKLIIYRDFAAASPLAEFTSNQPAADAAAVRAALIGYDPTIGFAKVPVARLAAAIRSEPSLVVTLLSQIARPDGAPEALAMLGNAAALAKELALDGQTLAQTFAKGYDDLQSAAEGLVATFRAKYPDEADFADKIAPSEDIIRSRKRDALTDYMICSKQPEFKTKDELYEFFLIDVQLEGCARTSRVVAGLSALQLYVHRILINLEQNRYPPEDPLYTHVEPSRIPPEEWVWRKNYRVWEANRKVFLYPEDYIEPDLRDDKTPLFEELEQTLFQRDINEQTVLEAYAKYLAGFDEIAKLKVAGAYHDKHWGERTDILHLVGVTQSDPPIFYYRAVENAFFGAQEIDRGVVWGPWYKIDVQISTRVVSPVVYSNRLYIFWVECATRPNNSISGGESKVTGYRHDVNLRYTMLRSDGTWSPPRTVTLPEANIPVKGSPSAVYDGVIDDPLINEIPRYEKGKRKGLELEKYTLQDYCWDRIYPNVELNGELFITGLGFATRGKIDFVNNTLVEVKKITYEGPWDILTINTKEETSGLALYAVWPRYYRRDTFAQATLIRHTWNYDYVEDRILSVNDAVAMFFNFTKMTQIADVDKGDELTTINASCGVNGISTVHDAFIRCGHDVVYLQWHLVSLPFTSNYIAKRLGTMLADKLTSTLYTLGVEGLLDIKTQKDEFQEPGLPFTLVGDTIDNKVVSGKMDFTGSLGTYFREIFFHIPALIANHLNSQGKYLAAQRWYHFLFNPTASETIDVPPAESDKEFRRRDRVWRYIEFRNRAKPDLRAALTDQVALETYKKDPFNPHAIARLRLSAYQKTIVMKYIDNLMDWGDSLFAQFTTESINEAEMLYVMASDILGPRPAKLGPCDDSAVKPKTYETIEPHIGAGEDILIELEQMLLPQSTPKSSAGLLKKVRPEYVIDSRVAANIGSVKPRKTQPSKIIVSERQAADWGLRRKSETRAATGPAAAQLSAAGTPAKASGPDYTALKERLSAEPIILNADDVSVARHIPLNKALPSANRIARPFDWAKTGTGMWAPSKGGEAPVSELVAPGKRWQGRNWHFGRALVQQVGPVFCVPENKDLLGYWDRVEDRLFKIRNCMDLSGVKRLPALFAPEIDPGLLVRARAAGLSLEDVLNAAAGSLPPYRFTYLIEKAKQHASTLQSYGSALNTALERRDNEELERLRRVHQQNILKMTTRQRELDITVAKETIEQYSRQKASVEYRRGYYQGLLDTDLIDWEKAQQTSRHIASVALGIVPAFRLLHAIFHLLPQIGAPTAMKYGGQELGNAWQGFSAVLADVATVAEQVGASAGLEATFARRREDWHHQVEVASRELSQIEKQISAAEIHKEIAERALDLHKESIRQEEEIFDFQNERFTNLGLFTYLSTTLQRLFREAYNGAMAMARLAEQAYRFERNDEKTPLLEMSYWEASRAGLLSGEKLTLDLQSMERRFIETDVRSLEVTQSFSLAQLDPAALINLKQNGTCEFAIPEVLFDIHYPGQYRRRIKAVRLTMPCVTGPYTNVGATLTMTGSEIRPKPVLGETERIAVPLRRSTTIATSTAQNDAGVFEFSFRDERYMPFEGAGAISSWQLSLPKNFRPFDYQTITDAIVHIAYTAEYDGGFAENVEADNATTAGTIANILANNTMTRTFSLRQEFPSQFARLLHSALNTEVQIEITSRHFPFFLPPDKLEIATAKLVLSTPTAQTATNVIFAVKGKEVKEFTRESSLGNLFAKDVGMSGNPIGAHLLTVKNAGDLAPTPVPGDVSALDADKLQDILLHVEFKLA